jgi:hypothetical protein
MFYMLYEGFRGAPPPLRRVILTQPPPEVRSWSAEGVHKPSLYVFT